MDYKHATIEELMEELSDGGGVDPEALKETERRLRAADALLVAAKLSMENAEPYSGVDVELDKAIAAYEGE